MDTVVINDLHKSYGDVHAVRGVSFSVRRGEVFALLGPNGAGETTIVEILEGFRAADAGTISVLGAHPARGGSEWRDRIGIVLQQSGIERDLTVREALVRLTRFYSRPADPDELIGLFGLEAKADARIKTLSGGQRRRLDLAAALAGTPELLFLDEPTTGFDPAARREAWAFIERLAEGGATVMLTTHYLDEVQRLADRVAVISSGVIVAEGDTATLGGRERAEATISFRTLAAELPEGICTVGGGDGWTTITTPDVVGALDTVISWARGHRIALEGLEVHRPTLEDVYLELVGAGASE